jgi:hypothetical protein
MRSRWGAGLCLLVAVGCSSGESEPAAAGRGLPSGAIHVEKAAIVDANGFEAPMAAATLFLPRGWQSRGGVQWASEFMCTNGYNFDWSASSPDGQLNVLVLPQVRWEWNNIGAGASNPGCGIAQIQNVRQYLEAVLQQRLPQARVLDYRAREDLRREIAHFDRVTPMPMGEARTWSEAGEILFAFSDERGNDMRGSAAASVSFSLLRTNAGAGLQTMESLTGFANPGYAVTAPNGHS